MSTTVRLSQMVDLALGTPEMGAVNFNVLHNLLHAMIQKLDLADVKAEIPQSDKDYLTTAKEGEQLSEEKGSLDSKDTESAAIPQTRSHYHQLEAKVSKIESQLEKLNSLPSTTDLINRTQAAHRGDEVVHPVSDMWQLMQLTKKVDANESGVGKLFSLVEDLMKEMQALKEAQEELRKQMKGLDLSELEKKFKELDALSNDLNARLSLLPQPEEIVTWPLLEDALKGLRIDMDQLQIHPPERVVIEMTTQTEQPKMVSRPVSARPVSAASSAGPSEELANILEILGQIGAKHTELDGRVDELEQVMPTKADKADLNSLGVPENLLAQIEHLKEELQRLAKLREKDSEAITRAQQAVLELQADVEKLNNTSTYLMDENNNNKKQIEVIFEQTERLDNIKADKEFVAMEVEVKADKRLVDGKVNRSVFDSTCSELQKMINDLLEKLAAYEEVWKRAHGELTDDVDGKLDRMELDDLKNYIDAKLKAIAKKIHPHTETWPPQDMGADDAAGIRKQLIHRFNCISCDRPVDMSSQVPNPSIPIPGVLPATRSPRPYTTFELESIRTHAKSLNGPVPEVISTDYYATMRPCGGIHTMTQPNRRITRTNVKEIYAEEDIPVSTLYKEEKDIVGVDGHVYRGRNGGMIEARLPSAMPESAQPTYPVAPLMRPSSPGQRSHPPPSAASRRDEHIRPSSARMSGSRLVTQRLNSRPQTASVPSNPANQQDNLAAPTTTEEVRP